MAALQGFLVYCRLTFAGGQIDYARRNRDP